MRLQVLNDHNKLRSQLANGESVANGGHKMPKSSNMQELVKFIKKLLRLVEIEICRMQII